MRPITTVPAVLIALGMAALAITPAWAARVERTGAHSVVYHHGEPERLLLLRSAEERRHSELRRLREERIEALRHADRR